MAYLLRELIYTAHEIILGQNKKLYKLINNNYKQGMLISESKYH